MGTPDNGGVAANAGTPTIHAFYSAASWIEGSAVDQLHHVATLPGVSKITAFPDLHPGKYGPVGCAVLADRIYPHLVGNDIGCGMSLFALDMPARKLRIDKAAQKLRALEGSWQGDAAGRLSQDGFSADLHTRTLGTIGGGNHFCELQMVAKVFDADLTAKTGLVRDALVLLVHSGSRSLGTEVFGKVQDVQNGFADDELHARTYLHAHDVAVRWARLNRQIIAERAAEALRTTCVLIADSPHNLIEAAQGGYMHRKGAAKADLPFVPLAGSRDALSYLLSPTPGQHDALVSLAHGAGRKYDRRSMSGRVGATRSDREKLERTSFGGQVICEDRQLLIEEAPGAYKDSGQVLDDLMNADLAKPMVSLKPLLTFKKASREITGERTGKRERLSRRRPKP